MELRIICLFIGFLLNICSSSPPETLRLAQALFRHGDRSPTHLYPKDPYNKNFSHLWPKGVGQLTKTGMMQHYKLGQYMRTRYDGYLPAVYNRKYVTVRSTDIDRTLMSAQCHLAGLYKPADVDVWNPDLLWQPIPIHTVPVEEDHLLSHDAICPRYTQLYNQYLHSEKIQKMQDKYKELFKELVVHTGYEFVNFSNAFSLFDTLFIERLYNLTLPKWVTPVVYKTLKFCDQLDFVLMGGTTHLKRLMGGPLVKEMIQNMEGKINDSSSHTTRLHLYSAHDSTIATLLDALNMTNRLAPPYASCVITELHEVNPGDFRVQVYYKNESDHEPYQLTLPGCEFSCPLGKFKNILQPVIPGDMKVECAIETSTPGSNPTISGALVYGSIVCIGFLLVLLQAIIICIIKKKRTVRYSHLSEIA